MKEDLSFKPYYKWITFNTKEDMLCLGVDFFKF